MLVSVLDPTLYCMAEFKLTARNKAAYERNEKTHEEGTTLIISNVAVVDDKASGSFCTAQCCTACAKNYCCANKRGAAKPKLRLDGFRTEPPSCPQWR